MRDGSVETRIGRCGMLQWDLELVAGDKLDSTRIHLRRLHLSEIWRTDGRERICELRMVEGVEEIAAQFERMALLELKSFQRGKVPIVHPRAVEDISSEIPVSSGAGGEAG